MSDLFHLMNKDNIVLTFAPDETGFSEDVSFVCKEVNGKTPYGFTDINAWIEQRKGLKHNRHLADIMRNYGCDNNLGFIKLTHAVGINDTFWIKTESENIKWSDVSLYTNQFSEVISKLAFEGMGVPDEEFSTTSPELTCDGSFRKCFRKEAEIGEYGNNIFMYKRGGELGAGYEPYCEVLASEIAGIITGNKSVHYNICSLHDKTASRCNVFSDESYGYASFAKLSDKNITVQGIFNRFHEMGMEEPFREMLVIDALCFNQDRHMGNYGVLFNNDTLEITGMAPVFDMNISMLPYAKDEDLDSVGDYLYDIGPRLGDDFTRIGQIAVFDSVRDRIKDIKDYSFKFRGDDTFTEARIKVLEGIIHKQAEALLSHEKLYTRDVYFSQKEKDKEIANDKAKEAQGIQKDIEQKLPKEFDSGLFMSVCDDSNNAQFILENIDGQECIIDLVARDVAFISNGQNVSVGNIEKDAPAFCKDVLNVLSIINETYIQKGYGPFLGDDNPGGSPSAENDKDIPQTDGFDPGDED